MVKATQNMLVNKEDFALAISKQFGLEIDEVNDFIVKFKKSNSKSKSPSKNEPGDWSTEAKKLATEYGLTAEDFPEEERTGRKLKGGKVQISISDVRNKLPELKDALGEKAFTSKGVYDLAMEHDLSPSDFNTKGKIKLSDVKAMIESKN